MIHHKVKRKETNKDIDEMAAVMRKRTKKAKKRLIESGGNRKRLEINQRDDPDATSPLHKNGEGSGEPTSGRLL